MRLQGFGTRLLELMSLDPLYTFIGEYPSRRGAVV